MAKQLPKTLDGRIANVIGRSKALADDIHTVALECLLHADVQDDPRKLDRLIKGLHASVRPVALKTWVEKYSPVRWNGDGDVGIMKTTAKSYIPFDHAAAAADPYWTPAETITKPLTLAALKAMIANMEKKVEKVESGAAEVAEGENIVDMRAFVERAKLALAA